MKSRIPALGRAVKRFVRDPLAHFLVIGALLFAAYSVFHARDEDRITVSRENLLTFIQYRSKAFDPHVAEAKLAALSPAELKQVIKDYVAEEALYREAEALGLDKQDYIIKRRMVQKVEFIAGGMDQEDADVSDEQLRAYFRNNMERFATPSAYTFTQVFVSREGRNQAALKQAAGAMKKRLVAERAGFDDAPRFGDRFPYGVNFVEASPDQIEGEFGSDFLRQLQALKPGKREWQGPIVSQFGAHIIMLVGKSDPKPPRFEDVREQVRGEASRALAEQRTDETVAKIVARYPVEMTFDDPRLQSQ